MLSVVSLYATKMATCGQGGLLLGDVLVARSIDHEHRDVRVVLRREGLEHAGSTQRVADLHAVSDVFGESILRIAKHGLARAVREVDRRGVW